jgi:hypothetical protein
LYVIRPLEKQPTQFINFTIPSYSPYWHYTKGGVDGARGKINSGDASEGEGVVGTWGRGTGRMRAVGHEGRKRIIQIIFSIRFE